MNLLSKVLNRVVPNNFDIFPCEYGIQYFLVQSNFLASVRVA